MIIPVLARVAVINPQMIMFVIIVKSVCVK
ncbi:MAG: hypothetical protein HW420_206 [Candidatus Nitrosotenuis sp.]|nr:hypothetical protein [Candidatus Nitrosotenuis sp.]